MRRNLDYHSLLGEGNPLLYYRRLREAAIDEFARKEYEDASLNDILKKARMSKGSFYHHFGDKFGLYLAMMDIIIDKKLPYFYPLMRQEVDTSDFFSMLKGIVKATMNFMLADERMHHLSNRVMEESAEFRNRLLSFFVHDYSKSFTEYVDQAVKSGQIDSRCPPEFVARVIEIMLANLHPKNARIIKDMIAEFRAKGGTVFLTTHLMNDVEQLCDRVAFCVNGGLVEISTPRDLKLKYGKRSCFPPQKQGFYLHGRFADGLHIPVYLAFNSV